MFCFKCGKKIPDDSLFCMFCGADIITAVKGMTESDSQIEQTEEQDTVLSLIKEDNELKNEQMTESDEFYTDECEKIIPGIEEQLKKEQSSCDATQIITDTGKETESKDENEGEGYDEYRDNPWEKDYLVDCAKLRKQNKSITDDAIEQIEYEKALQLSKSNESDGIERAYDLMMEVEKRHKSVPAMMWLAEFNENVLSRDDEAAMYYHRAADAGEITAMKKFGEMCLSGRGVKQDIGMGKLYLTRAEGNELKKEEESIEQAPFVPIALPNKKEPFHDFTDAYILAGWKRFADIYLGDAVQYSLEYYKLLAQYKPTEIGVNEKDKVFLKNASVDQFELWTWFLYQHLEGCFEFYMSTSDEFGKNSFYQSFRREIIDKLNNNARRSTLPNQSQNKSTISQGVQYSIRESPFKELGCYYRDAVTQPMNIANRPMSGNTIYYPGYWYKTNVADRFSIIFTDSIIHIEGLWKTRGDSKYAGQYRYEYPEPAFAEALQAFAKRIFENMGAQLKPYIDGSIKIYWQEKGLCTECGGKYKGIFKQKCSGCGAEKRN